LYAYFVELMRMTVVGAEPTYDRQPEPHVSFGAAQQAAIGLAKLAAKDGARTFRIVDETGTFMISES
jgi:hypothetical protein